MQPWCLLQFWFLLDFGFTKNINLSLTLLAFVGLGTVIQLVTMNTVIQIAVPDELRGRVFSIYFWALQGVAPFGSFAIGWMAQTWNVPITIIVGGLICLVGILVIRVTFRDTTKPLG